MSTKEHEFVEISPSPEKALKAVKGPGETLRNARFALNLSEADIANQMRLSRRIIVALENDNYGKLPGVAFVKGYLRSYARIVNLPGDEIIAKLEQIGYPEQDAPPPVPQNYMKVHHHKGEKAIRWVTYLIILGLLTLVFLWWKGSQTTTDIASPGGLTSLSALEDNMVNEEQSVMSLINTANGQSPIAADNDTSQSPS